MNRIEALDEQLFWWINGHHTPWLDWPLWTFSQGWCWALVLLTVCVVAIRHDRPGGAWLLIGIALCFLLADQISNNVIKDGVMRLRPCHALEEVRMFHTGKGGLYGFVSSHAANAFAVAMFISLCYGGRNKFVGALTDGQHGDGPSDDVDNSRNAGQRKHIKLLKSWFCHPSTGWRSPMLPWIMLGWATVVGYSRPYLGKHYPGDVLCGALLGMGLGALVYFVISKIRARVSSTVSA